MKSLREQVERQAAIRDLNGSLVVKRGGARVRVLIVLALLGLMSAGCQTNAYVRINVKPDGSGSVVVDVYLDAEAAKQVGDLSQILAVNDLKKAGWAVIGPAAPKLVAASRSDRKESDPGPSNATLQVHLSHTFSNFDEANALLASLNGPDGPYKNVRISTSSSLFSRKVHVVGTVDLSKGLDAFSDAKLSKALGAPLSEVVARSGGPVPTGDALRVSLQIEPRSGQSWSGEKGNAGVTPELVSAQTSLGASPQRIDVTSSSTRWGSVFAIGVVGLVVCVVAYLLVTAPARRKRRYRGRHARRR